MKRIIGSILPGIILNVTGQEAEILVKQLNYQICVNSLS